MKICLISEHATTNFGIGTHLQSLAIALKKRGHDVFLITNDIINENPSGMKIYQYHFVRFDKISNKILFVKEFISFLLFVAIILFKERPDVIHSHSFYDFYAAKLTSIFLHIPVITTHHSYVLSCPINTRICKGTLCELTDERACVQDVSFLINLRKIIARRIHVFLADAIIALNRIEFDFFNKISKKVYFISNWIDTNLFTPRLTRTRDKTIVFVGGFREVKRLDVLLHAFKNIIEIDPTYQLVVVGDLDPISSGLSSLDQKKFSEYLRDLIKKYHLLNNIEFTGVIPKSEMPLVYSRASLFVSTSFTEVNPISFLEALACQLPIVAFTNPLDFDITVSTPENLERDIKSTMKNGFDEAVFENVRKNFSEDIIVIKIEKLYRGLANRKKNG
ncbi:MAG TPA: glycosyltransferase family 4 protein [Candidatus Lokiarchaeia archaeon]|nr:glycosyltransferase family 4 protein [Candidatus Lokiarchaeia archaeon]